MTRTAPGVDIGVLWDIRMPAWAMRLGFLMRAAFLTCISSLRIYAVRHRVKVLWIHAGRIAAKVVEVMLRRNRSLQKLVGESVSGNEASPVPEIAVAKRNLGGGPYPAGFGFLHLRPEALCRCFGWAGKSPGLGILSHAVIIIEVM